MPKPTPGKVVVVDEVPTCNFCETPGPYDFKTKHGPWAHGCEVHWRQYRVSPTLGTGKAQLLVTADQVDDATG